METDWQIFERLPTGLRLNPVCNQDLSVDNDRRLRFRPFIYSIYILIHGSFPSSPFDSSLNKLYSFPLLPVSVRSSSVRPSVRLFCPSVRLSVCFVRPSIYPTKKTD